MKRKYISNKEFQNGSRLEISMEIKNYCEKDKEELKDALKRQARIFKARVRDTSWLK